MKGRLSGLAAGCASSLAVATVLSSAACSVPAPGGSSSEGAWAGSIETEGDVTTVINESGSVWGGKARLVEELVIGEEAGPDEYMFGRLNSIYANDERIVVADTQADVVRMYDQSGAFLFNVGGRGQGPGEYVDPDIVTMDRDGRTFVFDSVSDRVSEFDPSGEFVTSREVDDFGCCAWGMHAQEEGLLWIPIEERDREDPRERRYGAQLYSMDDGPAGEPLWVPEIEFEPTTYEDAGREIPTRFSPRLVWYPTPDGGIVAGASDRYRFEILRPDGFRTVVHHHAEPAPVEPNEWEWTRRLTVATRRSYERGFNWDGAEMPRHRPAYHSLMGAVSGEIWVWRAVGSERVSDCAEDPLEEYPEYSSQFCFRPVYTIDAFGGDGRFLGQVETPPDMRPFNDLYIDGDAVIGRSEDESGVVRLKRYRLVLSGEQ